MLEIYYEPLVGVLAAGRAGRLRQNTLEAAGIGTGDDVLDIGCATGPLTRLARQATQGRVIGLDASPRMLDRARQSGTGIDYVQGRAEDLPFPDGHFDVVFLSLVLHYLPIGQAAQAIAEARRCLRPAGRIVVVDFARATGITSRVRAHLMLHGGTAATAPNLPGLLRTGGFNQVETLPCPIPALTITRGVHTHPSQGVRP